LEKAGDHRPIRAGQGAPHRRWNYKMSRSLIIFGLLCVAAGVLWPVIGKLGLGRLPGDIYIERPGYSLYFPLMTSLVISLALSVIFWLANR
jgi:Protein of unknown function (DUF2905)